jgi:hypothetical protein
MTLEDFNSMTTFKGCVPVAPDAVRVWRGFRKHDLQQSSPTGLDGLIVMVDENQDGSGYLLYWEHWAEGTAPAADPLEQLTGLVDVAFHKNAAEPMNVIGGFYDVNVGVVPAIEGDQLVRLQFLRRRLAVENGRAVSGPLT